MSPTGTSKPFSPSCTTSATPPAAVAITGVPTASASTTVCGKFSQLEESTAASAAANSSSTVRAAGRRAAARATSPRSATSRSTRAAAPRPSPAIDELHVLARRHGAEQHVERLLGGQPPGERERRTVEPELQPQLLARRGWDRGGSRSRIREHARVRRGSPPRERKVAEVRRSACRRAPRAAGRSRAGDAIGARRGHRPRPGTSRRRRRRLHARAAARTRGRP